ncbi:histidine phosphatase family protein [Streptomyces sp. NBC_00083]|uniref:histidine phosphatase family protein n=1 Tax=Streptomyces sp. NBC_00083 TaxID=2975647 RepID=UPI002252C160|nr:histidine phosphatase family protein [Streptomyces sp. NBC_00083]MCX5387341.1 histidine phosphatase family protein [Streptomyces sp. NBC_00083]
MDLYLLRHAEDRAGQHDPHGTLLTGAGRRQARAAAHWLAERRPTEIRTSVLPRARLTADIVAEHTGLAVREDPRLNEIVWASLDGERLPNPREDRLHPPPPGAESWHAFMTRVATCMSELCHRAAQDQRIVLVTHSGFFDAVNELLCGGAGRVELLTAHAGITHWQYRPAHPGGAWLLHQHNASGVLSPPTDRNPAGTRWPSS